MLNENEKIDSWDIVVKTTDGRELSFAAEIERKVGDLSLSVTEAIDEFLTDFFPCTWAEDDPL